MENYKKNKILFVGFVFLLLLAGCSQVEQIKSLTFQFNDGAVSPQYYSEGVLLLTPDYDLRTLYVRYTLTHPHRTDETLRPDISTEGVIGGEYFDRFENLLSMYPVLGGISETTCTGGYNMSLLIQDSDGQKRNKSFYLCGKQNRQIDMMENLYLDIVTMMTENVY